MLTDRPRLKMASFTGESLKAAKHAVAISGFFDALLIPVWHVDSTSTHHLVIVGSAMPKWPDSTATEDECRRTTWVPRSDVRIFGEEDAP